MAKLLISNMLPNVSSIFLFVQLYFHDKIWNCFVYLLGQVRRVIVMLKIWSILKSFVKSKQYWRR